MLKFELIVVYALVAATMQWAIGSPAPPDSEFTLHADSELVVLSVGVQDAHGLNVGGLAAQDFKVYEDGREQPIKQFAAEDRPVTVGILLDASGSMRTRQAQVIAAASAFIQASNPEDEIFVVTFNDRSSLGLPPGMPFSSDRRQLEAALSERKPEGRTALYDALTLGVQHLAKGKWENKTLLVISDGGDNNSIHSSREAVHSVQMSGATLYTIALFDPDEPEHNTANLDRLARMSGGESFSPKTVDEINPVCLRIAKDIRASYTLAYTPPRPDEHTAVRRIKVVLTSPAGRKFKVRNRTGYVLSAP